MHLSTPIEQLPRIGPQYQKKLKRLGIKTVGQLFFHFPHRYEDFSDMVTIDQAKGKLSICIQGRVIEIKNIRTWKRRMTLTQAVVEDNTGTIKVTWFNQPYLINTLKKGDLLFLAGKMSKNGQYLSSPAYEKMLSIKTPAPIHTGRLVPVYPETEGLSSRWLRFILKPLLNKAWQIPDPLPEKIRSKHNFLPFKKAIEQIHFPDSLEAASRAKRRFIFEELFILSLFVLREKMKINRQQSSAVPIDADLLKNFTGKLAFDLTDDQKKASWQILKDLEKPRPMNRLLEGDVGSGKTVVAAMAALNTAKAGFQTVIMAPTEILTKQHFKGLNSLFSKFSLKTGLMTGRESKVKDKKIPRKELLKMVREGKIDILIGTHALVQEEVKFKNLALAVIDEQHRFGVEQRARLCSQKDLIPHLLSMTATPIPRTLSLTIYGDLDLSLIKEMPKGRKKVVTRIIPPDKRQETYDFIRQEVKGGRQVFVICPRIEPAKASENSGEGKYQALNWLEVKAAKEEYGKLSKTMFPDLKVGLLHGKLKSQEKERVMRAFKKGSVDILVSTSVVEVGVDFPNATIMMIEGAEKFGLAQLHQFRGRVGRGEHQSFCFLFTDSKGQKTSQRLRAVINSENGFDLAEKDLLIRGPGDFIGQRQWGVPDLAMSALKDLSLVESTRQEAREILENDPKLIKYAPLRERLGELQKNIHLE